MLRHLMLPPQWIRMLKTRVITAFALLFALLPGLFLSPQWLWALIAALIASLAAWEWGGFARFSAAGRIACAAGMAALCLLPLAMWPDMLGIVATGTGAGEAGSFAALQPARWIYLLSLTFWLLLVPFWLYRKWQLDRAWLALLAGLLVIYPAFLALVQLRLLGPTALFFLMGTVWIADIAAYFSGRRFGRVKLAPAISPGKTREGAIGAVIVVTAYGLLLREGFGVTQPAAGWWIPALVLITAVSIMGDLFESLLKRQAGIKDSSNLLPGHGGVMDRIDSLTSTLPMIACIWLFAAG